MTAFDHRQSLTAVVGAVCVFSVVSIIGGEVTTSDGVGLEAAGATLVAAAAWPRRTGRSLGIIGLPMEYWGTVLVVAGIVILTMDL